MNDLRTTERNLPPTHVLPFAPSPSHSAKPGVYTGSTVFDSRAPSESRTVPVLLANFVNFRIYSQTRGACGRVGGRVEWVKCGGLVFQDGQMVRPGRCCCEDGTDLSSWDGS
jgi:hypothetical protein